MPKNEKKGVIMPSCTQCGKSAIISVGNNPLCVDCYLKFQQATQMQNATQIQKVNYLTDMIEAKIGIYGVLPRYKVPQSMVHQGSLTFHNIKVDQSVVGSINTGEVQRIDIAMSHIKIAGNEELVKALKEFTEAVIAETKLNAELKNQIIEQISFLASQSALPKENQKSGIVKAVLLRVKDTICTITTLASLWDKLEPILEQVFF